jgi:hypothetical protein
MAKGKRKSKPAKTTEDTALYIAMVIRNALEDFHCWYLSDEQMRELNPIVRNAVCTALHAVKRSSVSQGARSFLDFHTRMIPEYWERPVLLDDFLEIEALLDGTDGDGGG